MKFLIVLCLAASALGMPNSHRPIFHDGYDANVNAIVRPAALPAMPEFTANPSEIIRPIIRPAEPEFTGIPSEMSRPIIRPAVPAVEEARPIIQIIVNVEKAEDVQHITVPAELPEVGTFPLFPEEVRPVVIPEIDGHRPVVIPDIEHRPVFIPDVEHRPVVLPEVGTFPLIPEEHRPVVLPEVGTFPLIPEEHRPVVLPEDFGHRPAINQEIGHRPAVNPDFGDFMARPDEAVSAPIYYPNLAGKPIIY